MCSSLETLEFVNTAIQYNDANNRLGRLKNDVKLSRYCRDSDLDYLGRLPKFNDEEDEEYKLYKEKMIDKLTLSNYRYQMKHTPFEDREDEDPPPSCTKLISRGPRKGQPCGELLSLYDDSSRCYKHPLTVVEKVEREQAKCKKRLEVEESLQDNFANERLRIQKKKQQEYDSEALAINTRYDERDVNLENEIQSEQVLIDQLSGVLCKLNNDLWILFQKVQQENYEKLCGISLQSIGELKKNDLTLEERRVFGKQQQHHKKHKLRQYVTASTDNMRQNLKRTLSMMG